MSRHYFPFSITPTTVCVLTCFTVTMKGCYDSQSLVFTHWTWGSYIRPPIRENCGWLTPLWEIFENCCWAQAWRLKNEKFAVFLCSFLSLWCLCCDQSIIMRAPPLCRWLCCWTTSTSRWQSIFMHRTSNFLSSCSYNTAWPDHHVLHSLTHCCK